jgi:putative oxidoreductase
MTQIERWAPQMLGVLRILTGLLFMEHGLMKLVHFPAAGPGGGDSLSALMLIAGLIETVGGGLVALGLFTRLAAFICSGEMAFAYFMAHFPKSFWPTLNGGEAAIFFCFVFLYLFVAGPGAFSLDARFRPAKTRLGGSMMR